MRLVEVDLAEGPDAAREAAVRGMVELALGPDSKDAIAEFFLRSRDGFPHEY